MDFVSRVLRGRSQVPAAQRSSQTCDLWTFRDAVFVFIWLFVCLWCVLFCVLWCFCVFWFLFVFVGLFFVFVQFCFCHVPAPRLVRLGDHNRAPLADVILYVLCYTILFHSTLYFTIICYTILHDVLHTLYKMSITHGFAFGPL